jgi:hypothetical protein
MSTVPPSEAFAAFQRSLTHPPAHPILHGPSGTLVTFGLPSADGTIDWAGVWITPTGPRFLQPFPPVPGPAAAHGLTGPSADLFDTFLIGSRIYLERVEEVDGQLAGLQESLRSVSLSDVWKLQRRLALIRAQIGRALVGLAECGGRFETTFPGFGGAMTAVTSELVRVQELAQNVHQALSDLIMLRSAEESNRIAAAANELNRVSNRIASLANTSNIRMLGITYVALLLGLVSAVVLIPNTGATILGMPSAAWVPGLWVDGILVVLAVIPIALVFSRPWVRVMLKGFGESELRVSEGVRDLPEMTASGAPEPIPTAPSAAGKRL